jgi:putative transposase
MWRSCLICSRAWWSAGPWLLIAMPTQQALQMALLRRHPASGLVHHSDRGSQYTSGVYQSLLVQFAVQVSMSGKGDCYDNAAMESFISSLKGQWTDWHAYQTRKAGGAVDL